MPCDSCQCLGDAMLGVLGLLVVLCVGLNTSSLLWLHLRPLVQHLLHLCTPKLDALSRPAAPPARPRSPPAVPGAWGASSPTEAGRRPRPGAHLSSRRPPASAPPSLKMEEPGARPGACPAVPHKLGGHTAPRPAHRARVYVSPGWSPPPPSPGGVSSEGWQGGSVCPPSPSFACWNREGSGVLH
ncbi:basic proline-rich protein-like [Mauremys reevesii]|uniref:basic proline-rich protein-like n=1 Tax=Mauremys reevesii TaxID=260615 RepID=UPI00193F2727|nr:basic proline-rich protein-like [Mauremys reevesii]